MKVNPIEVIAVEFCNIEFSRRADKDDLVDAIRVRFWLEGEQLVKDESQDWYFGYSDIVRRGVFLNLLNAQNAVKKFLGDKFNSTLFRYNQELRNILENDDYMGITKSWPHHVFTCDDK